MWQQKASDDALTEYFYIEHDLLDATARLSAQKYFLGGGMVKNKPHSLKLILLLRTDIGLGKFT